MAIKRQKPAKKTKPSQADRPPNPFSLHAAKHSTNKKKKHTKKKPSLSNPNRVPLGDNPTVAEIQSKEKKEKEDTEFQSDKKKKRKRWGRPGGEDVLLSALPAAQQLPFFLDRFQAACGLKLSPLELEAFKDTCVVEFSQGVGQDVEHLSEHIKNAVGDSWKEALTEGKISEGIDAGSPAILVISSSALRSLELLRGLRVFTKECRPAKLFAKHIKLEDQVSILKGRVNIASGTPSRIKKLIDMDAMLLSRLSIVVLDLHRDVKGYSLLTLPQVSAEFWDLYRSHFHHRHLQGDTRICFYGPISLAEMKKVATSD